MSCRRARIKAVASLLVRRKPNTSDAAPAPATAPAPAPAGPSTPTSKKTPQNDSSLPDKECSEATLPLPEPPQIIEAPPVSEEPPPPDVGIRPLSGTVIAVPVDEQAAPVVSEAAEAEPDFLNAECNFDPIVPLPAMKNRPKLRPPPKFAVRRDSVHQTPASESEDESKRIRREEPAAAPRIQRNAYPVLTSLVSEGRMRRESCCSIAGDSNHPIGSMTPRYKITRTWKTGSMAGETARRAAAKRKALEKPSHNALTMYDLIFYNPPDNGISSTPDVANKESVVDDPEPVAGGESAPVDAPVAVPQVKIGPDGNIVIDEKSLVIETTDSIRSRELLSKCSIVYDNDGESNSKNLYKRIKRTRDWTHSETLRFYRALNTLGTDFSLMLSLFPGRSRRDLKVKFKREERINSSFVDRALSKPLKFDLSELEKQLEKEKQENEFIKQVRLKKDAPNVDENKKKKSYRRTSFASQCIELDEDSMAKPSRPKRQPPVENTPNEVIQKPADPQLTSPQRLLPPDVKSGSVVVFANEDPNEPGTKAYKAYIVNITDGVTKLNPLNMPKDLLQKLATKMAAHGMLYE